jgi:hypothetical protein
MPTKDYHKIAKYLQNWLNANKAALGLQAVYYGDQNLIPKTPSLCVQPGTVERTLSGALWQTDNFIDVLLLIYHGEVQSKQVNQEECDVFTVAVEDFLHTDHYLSNTGIDAAAPLITQGFVTRIEAGSLRRDGKLMFASRLTYRAFTKTRIA